MAVEHNAAEMLLASWVLGLSGTLVSAGLVACTAMVMPSVRARLDEFLRMPLLCLLAWITFGGLILGMAGTALIYMAWSRAKEGRDPGSLGLIGGALLLIGMSGVIGIAGGILAITSALPARD